MDNITIKIKRKSDNSVFGIGKGYDWKLLKKGLEGFGQFDNIINYVDNGIHDGGLITSNRMTKCDRTISCAYINRKNNILARKKMTSFFNLSDTYLIYVTYLGRTLWAEGKIHKFKSDVEDNPTAMLKIMVTFTFANPYLKSFDDFGKDIASVSPMIGFPFMTSMDVHPAGLTGGVYNFDKRVSILNDGDVDTFCKAVFTASGEVVNPSLIIGDAFVKVNDTMESGDVIEMDFTALPPTVKKNGVNCIGKCDRSSRFTEMVINRGDVSISYDADDGDKNLAVAFYYNKLYASI